MLKQQQCGDTQGFNCSLIQCSLDNNNSSQWLVSLVLLFRENISLTRAKLMAAGSLVLSHLSPALGRAAVCRTVGNMLGCRSPGQAIDPHSCACIQRFVQQLISVTYVAPSIASPVQNQGLKHQSSIQLLCSVLMNASNDEALVNL